MAHIHLLKYIDPDTPYMYRYMYMYLYTQIHLTNGIINVGFYKTWVHAKSAR